MSETDAEPSGETGPSLRAQPERKAWVTPNLETRDVTETAVPVKAGHNGEAPASLS
jgi:hypothetical protein